jgi:F-type H+-transporting ATPase subunit alpha
MLLVGTAPEGHLMDIPTREVRRFLSEFLDHLESSRPELMETLRTKKALDDKLKADILGNATEFKKLFRAGV